MSTNGEYQSGMSEYQGGMGEFQVDEDEYQAGMDIISCIYLFFIFHRIITHRNYRMY
jgi:hypothetical protein